MNTAVPGQPGHSQRFTLQIAAPAGQERTSRPLRIGVPLGRGVCGDGRDVALWQGGERKALQRRVLDRWPDGSIRWVLLDWIGTAEKATVVLNEKGEDPKLPAEVRIRQEGHALTVDTGAASFLVRPGSNLPLAGVSIDGEDWLGTDGCRIVATDREGREHALSVAGCRILEQGPIRTSVLLESLASDDLPACTCELHFHAGRADVRVRVSIHNPQAAAHPGGMWDLGSPGSMYLKDLSVVAALDFADPPGCLISPERDSDPMPASSRMELYQESSGGANWDSTCHVNRDNQVPMQLCGYRWSADDRSGQGKRATPVLHVGDGRKGLAVAMEHFWQNFPKALCWDGEALQLGLLPGQFPDVHELQGGERKTHEFVLSFSAEPDLGALEWARRPGQVTIDPEWVARTGAIPYLLARNADPHEGYLRLVDSALEGEDTFLAKRERVDEYGWRNFGDMYADHEAIYYDGPDELVSHYNNQYDGIWGLGVQFLRSGDPRWFQQMQELALHVADIDMYHTDGDKSAYNHGLFWHTCHYVDAGRSTHRTYSADVDVPGGGPSGGHLYTSGLLLYHFLTGDRLAAEAVTELGGYAISTDDGSSTVFRFLSRRPTGHVSCSAWGYYGPGRASANSLNALLDAWRLTGRQRYLDQAELYIRRSIHPADDQDAMDLLNAEIRWFYTMFLQRLGKYLDMKAEHGQFDEMFRYAKAALLNYADWMAENEYPYLTKPELLEYPNETWAGQDMRKAEVFQLAARHSRGPGRERFLERCEFFFRQSVDTLRTWQSRTLTRPLVLMLSYGWSHAHLKALPLPDPPGPDVDGAEFGRPKRFIPQKEAAIRNFKILFATGAAIFLSAVAALVYLWLRA